MSKLSGATIKVPLGIFYEDVMLASGTGTKLITRGEVEAVSLLMDVYGDKYEITIGAYEMAAILRLAGYQKLRREAHKGAMEDA